MRTPTSDPMTGDAIVHQAAAIVGAAVRATLVDALRAAEVCRCRHCRAQAVRTFDWAVGLLEAERPGRGLLESRL